MVDGGSPQVQWRSVVLDCPDPPSLARFYGDLLNGTVHEDPDWSEVRLGSGSPKLTFQRVEQYVVPEWPDGQPQQLHLDITVANLAAASRHAVARGAPVVKEPVD